MGVILQGQPKMYLKSLRGRKKAGRHAAARPIYLNAARRRSPFVCRFQHSAAVGRDRLRAFFCCRPEGACRLLLLCSMLPQPEICLKCSGKN